MPITVPEWQHLAVYAVAAAVLIMLLQRLPVVGRFVRFAFSAALLAFFILILLQQAPYQPELSRLTSRLGLDDQHVTGKELRVTMASDGHFWVLASVNGVKTRMLIDSGATITAVSAKTARAPLPRRPARSTSYASATSSRATSGSSLRQASAASTCSE